MAAPDDQIFDVAVVGAGPAGLIAALAASRCGLSVALVGPRPPGGDRRSTALMDGTVRLLDGLGAWQFLAPVATTLAGIRLVDRTGGLLVAPEVTFRAEEIGLDAFGYNVANGDLVNALQLAVAGAVVWFEETVADFYWETEAAQLRLASGRVISCRLIAGADGRQSPARTSAGIAVSTSSYDQVAVVASFVHSRPHNNISTEFHRAAGPLTVVPGPQQTSSLVWVETKSEADRLLALDETEFSAELSRNLHGLLGVISGVSPRGKFVLAGQTAASLVGNRLALLGEAGHVMPPIGAQGLNLSIRDAVVLADVAAAAKSETGDAGSASGLQRYETLRRPDIKARQWTVDLLNTSLISPYVPVHLLRGAGLIMLASLPPLRRYVMKEGVAPSLGSRAGAGP